MLPSFDLLSAPTFCLAAMRQALASLGHAWVERIL